MSRFRFLLATIAIFAFGTPANAAPQWLTVPPTPTLPKTLLTGLADAVVVEPVSIVEFPAKREFYRSNLNSSLDKDFATHKR